jgi:hypothetical protein
MANETVTGTRIEDIIAIVSDLESETPPHNPVAAYFLEMCRFSLLNPDLRPERCPLLLIVEGSAFQLNSSMCLVEAER